MIANFVGLYKLSPKSDLQEISSSLSLMAFYYVVCTSYHLIHSEYSLGLLAEFYTAIPIVSEMNLSRF